jgi:hypothetical protein
MHSTEFQLWMLTESNRATAGISATNFILLYCTVPYRTVHAGSFLVLVLSTSGLLAIADCAIGYTISLAISS